MKGHSLTFVLLLLLAAPVLSQPQSKNQRLISEGNRYFAQEQYSLAISYFQDAISSGASDPAIDYKLAECYRKTFNYAEAEAYYLKVLYNGQSQYPLSLFYYGLMLKLNGNFAEAMQRFDQFMTFHQNNIALKEYVEQSIIEKAGCEIAVIETGLPVTLKPELLNGVNSIYNDFAPAFRDANTLVITSSRVTSNRKLIDDRNGEAFTDNYYFEKNGDQWQDHTKQHFSVANSLYHDGSGSFTTKGNQYFFTLCEERCLIYETHLNNEKWTEPSPLNVNINHPTSEAKHPAVSPGGDTLYFASTRPGGFGAFDIWMSVDTAENAWSEPINAGRIINTKANDITPAVSRLNSVLFFSSEGHPGYGGFDLFVAKVTSGGDTVLYNLNLPFNSIKDDCFLTFYGDDILWSSNRDGGAGGFDIYAGRNITPITLVSKLSVKNRNDSRTATLISRTARSENISLLASRNEESIDYNNLTYERKAIVNKMAENRLNNVANRREDFADLTQEEFDLLNEVSHVRFQSLLLKERYASTLLAELERVPGINGALSITGQLIDSYTGLALNGARVLLTNEYGEILKITNTNENGDFRFTDAPDKTRLFIRLENSAGRQVNAFVRNIQTQGSDKKNSLYVENVYFDFDHYVIRPEAAQVLQELAGYLKSNPGAQVEIYAFADDRGSSAYNFELTQKRGESVVAFLKKHGVDETSLAIIPKGKQQVRFATNEIQRQFNRRAEFYINGVRDMFVPSVKTYILKKEANWTHISQATGVSKDELQSLNGSGSDLLKAYQPIRVPMEAKTISEELFFVGI